MKKRFIEETFPVKEVNIEGSREKSIRHGHISTLHIWWARRPLATSRATNLAALIPVPKSELDKQNIRNFISDFSKWDNSNNVSKIEKARKMILAANNGIPPKVLDPFGGGGSIPLEAMRLGCEAYCNDYNPVAVLIQKCTLEFPQKFGQLVSKKKYFKERTFLKKTEINALNENDLINPLIEDVKYWGKWVLEQSRNEIIQFYPNDSDGSVPLGYIWARTIPCQNQLCGLEIPLVKQYWLASKSNKNVSIYPYIENKQILFKIVGDGYAKIPVGFDPEKGTVSRSVVTCPFCNSVIDDKTTRLLFQKKKNSERIIAVVIQNKNKSGRQYRIADENDMSIFNKASIYLNKRREKLINELGFDPVPDEVLPLMSGVFNVPLYGIDQWSKLFNERQNLSSVILSYYNKSLEQKFSTSNAELKVAVQCYIAFVFSSILDHNSTLCQWRGGTEDGSHVFGKQALPMNWDYFEVNPFSGSTGSFESALSKILRVIEHLSLINAPIAPTITNYSATNLNFPPDYFDAVFTDPPYYNSVPYADLSDFFYIWLKRNIGDQLPDIFSTPLTPKKNEITEMAGWDSVRYPEKNKIFFETNLGKAFKEISRVLKPDGIATIVYAHKSTAGWETVINALLDSGLVITASWPLNTEMQNRMRAKDSATLSSSIYIIARKMKRQTTGFYNEVKEELKQYLSEKLDHLWAEGITGSDFYIAAIGSGIEVFGKYEKVMDYEGNVKRADVLLDDVREIVMQYTVKQILHNGFSGEISELSKFYVVWRFSYGEAKAEFDEANKIARSVGIDLTQEWSNNGFIKKEKEFIRVLGPHNRKMDELDDSHELIDVLHLTLLLYEKGKKDDMMQLLASSGYGKSEAFFRVAQAISESLGKLTPDSKEKKLLDGFLGGKERIKSEVVTTKIKGSQQLNMDF